MLAFGVAALAVALPAAAAFGVAGALLDALPAALVGVVAYGSIVLAVRPPGLRRSWRYLRALG